MADEEANRQAQAEEMEALEAIYGSDCFSYSSDEHCCRITIQHPDSVTSTDSHTQPPTLTLLLHLPASYPSHAAPVAELARCDWLPDNARSRLCCQLDRMGGGGGGAEVGGGGGGGGGAHEGEARGGEEGSVCGEVVIFQWVEWIKEQEWVWQHAPLLTDLHETEGQESSRGEGREAAGEGETGAAETAEATARRGGGGRGEEGKVGESAEEGAGEVERALGIVHGVPFTEKRSTFQAHLAPVSSPADVAAVMDVLLANRKIAGATHNIMAYRIVTAGASGSAVIQDNDDDGEAAAGSRLMHLLQIVGAANVVVVVSRWFGGVLLGPDRFRHINNAARSLLVECGYVEQQQQQQKQQHKGKTAKARR
ncbi:unnamed protein product [Closterium sp. Yama58-4]|nr:unnamed protein product [Closterium sp. Yama58-4]